MTSWQAQPAMRAVTSMITVTDYSRGALQELGRVVSCKEMHGSWRHVFRGVLLPDRMQHVSYPNKPALLCGSFGRHPHDCERTRVPELGGAHEHEANPPNIAPIRSTPDERYCSGLPMRLLHARCNVKIMETMLTRTS